MLNDKSPVCSLIIIIIEHTFLSIPTIYVKSANTLNLYKNLNLHYHEIKTMEYKYRRTESNLKENWRKLEVLILLHFIPSEFLKHYEFCELKTYKVKRKSFIPNT